MKDSFQISQKISAPLEKVYAAWIDIESAKKWSAPEGCELTLFEADLKVGGRYRLIMKTPFGDMKAKGVYREISPAKRLVYTWVWDVPDTEENIVTVEFKAQGTNTELILGVTGFSVPEEVDSNREGWASSLGKLAKMFA